MRLKTLQASKPSLVGWNEGLRARQRYVATLFSRVQAVLDEGWAEQPTPVVVGLANWELGGEKLVRATQAMGWHFLLRVRRKVAYHTADGQEEGMWERSCRHGARERF